MGAPLVVAFMSGKGGVGKTMLAAAFAYEAARAKKTLLLDLDFFNRGLTGLLQHGEQAATVARPDFLDAGGAEAAPWKIVQVDRDLFHVAYLDLGAAEMSSFNETKLDQLHWLNHF